MARCLPFMKLCPLELVAFRNVFTQQHALLAGDINVFATTPSDPPPKPASPYGLQTFTVTIHGEDKGLSITILGVQPEQPPQIMPWGIMVQGVAPGGQSDQLGLREGDILKSANGILLQRVPNENDSSFMDRILPFVKMCPLELVIFRVVSQASGLRCSDREIALTLPTTTGNLASTVERVESEHREPIYEEIATSQKAFEAAREQALVQEQAVRDRLAAERAAHQAMLLAQEAARQAQLAAIEEARLAKLAEEEAIRQAARDAEREATDAIEAAAELEDVAEDVSFSTYQPQHLQLGRYDLRLKLHSMHME